MMGLAFDDNGVYTAWSSLFDYTSLATLNESEKLPSPQGIQYNLTKDGELDITEDLQKIKEQDDIIKSENLPFEKEEAARKRRLNLIGALLRKIKNNSIEGEDGSEASITYSSLFEKEDSYKYIVRLLQKHEKQKIPRKTKLDGDKNFISSHIQNTIQDPSNTITANIPVAMEDFREPAEKSPKGEQSKQITCSTPMFKFLMQNANMVGKSTTGVMANGAKATFIWTYFMQDALKKAKDAEDPILKYVKFSHTTKRIKGRWNGEPEECTINRLSDINTSGVEESVNKLFDKYTQGDIKPDNMDSQMISAATDVSRMKEKL